VLVWLIHTNAPELQTAVLLYLVPIILVASTWGRGPSITAVLAAVLGHDVFLLHPVGTLTIARAEDALGLVILLFTALVTSQLADSARRGSEKENEAAVARLRCVEIGLAAGGFARPADAARVDQGERLGPAASGW